ncbi:TonB-dependent receptor [Sphingomonas jeddahensis]|uniref:Colicin I receptor n=1 Tax=Sphingomonas jeddahensis TaxID=1915074 RepID=A0A1V2ES51_9SPHN|nr:TonB-dependent receptor [Sphingomonas jeddahensis]ONF95410.1 Colicin I receptor precursor [Sphingomonas jeddahensis]
MTGKGRAIVGLRVGASLMAVAMASVVQAQEVTPAEPVAEVAAGEPTQQRPSDTAIGDIVVTAQRRAESINRVGISVQALESETLQELRVQNVRDLAAVVPSFTVAQSYQGVPTYTLRGIGFNSINLSAQSTVGTYVDEVAYAYPIMNTGPLIDIERVEVLKGPQGTLYGRNTTAGLINFVTGKPSEDASGAMTVDVGNYETFNVGGYVTGPIAEGIQARVGYRVDLSNKGWQVSNSRGERLGEVKRYGIRGSLALQPGPFEIDLSATYWVNKSDTVVGQAIGFTPATTPGGGGAASNFNAPGAAAYIAANRPTSGSQADWAPYARRSSDIGRGAGLKDPLAEDNYFLGLKARVQLDLAENVRAVSLTGYNEYDRKATFDWSGIPNEVLIQEADGHIESFAQELRVEGDGPGLNWLVGAYYAKDKIRDTNRTLLGENANSALLRFATSQLINTPINTFGYTLADAATTFRTYRDEGAFDTTTWSVFVNGDYAFSDLIKLTLGARYTEDLQKFTGCSRDFNGSMQVNINLFNRGLYQRLFNPTGPLATPIGRNDCNTFNPATNSFGVVNSRLDENNFAWRGSLDVTPNATTLIYASISRGYKSGTSPINAASNAAQNLPARQEQLTAYEIGAKLGLLDRKVQLNLAGFYYDYKDKQISAYFADPIYTALARLDNIPKSEAYGIEGELTVRPVRPLTLIANALWLKTRINGYVGTNAAGRPQDFDGARFIYSPEWTLSGTALFDQPVSDALSFTANANVRWQSRQTTIFEYNPLYDIKPYTVVNAGFGVKAADESWALNVWARNLFDEYYWNAVASNANIVVRFPGQVRTYGATAAFRF